MKFKFVTFICILSVVVLIGACGGKTTSETTEASSDSDEWPQMDEFHTVMADVYHPLKDSGNVQPIMERAQELAAAAEKWANAPVPARVDNKEMKDMLAELKSDTRSLADEIKNGAPEDQAGTTLNELHELFHHIQEAWYGGKDEEEHHQH